MRFVSLAAAVMILLCGCSLGKEVRVKLDTKEYVTDVLDIKAQIPSFSGMENRDFENSINEGAENSTNAWIEEFMTNVPENTKAEFKAQPSVKYNENDFLSVVTDIYTYTGGAHGALARKSLNIDIKKCTTRTLKDLFSPDSDYRELLNRCMAQIIQSEPQKYSDLWEQPVMTESRENDFYIENGNLVIYYPPYELSYYSKGFVEFEIKTEDIKSYLKEEYKKFADVSG